MLDPSGAVNHSGNSVTTFIRNIATRPRRRAGRASSRPPLEMSRPQNPAATRDDTPGVLPPPAARRSPRDPHLGRTVALWERTPFPDFRRGGSPRPPPAGRAACAAARLRGRGRGKRWRGRGRLFSSTEYAGLLEERTHRIGRSRALLEPGSRLFRIHVDHRGIGTRVVIADRRDEASVAG